MYTALIIVICGVVFFGLGKFYALYLIRKGLADLPIKKPNQEDEYTYKLSIPLTEDLFEHIKEFLREKSSNKDMDAKTNLPS